jgi:TolB protein
MDVNGTNQVPLLSYLDFTVENPASRRDSCRIVFEYLDDILIMDRDGTHISTLTDDPAREEDPQFNADGTQVVFVSDKTGNKEIYLMDLDGIFQTPLTNTSSNNFDPTFTNDGDKIIFVSDRDGNDEIYIMNADGSSQTRLTFNTASDTNPAVSVNGFDRFSCNVIVVPAN